MNLRVLIISTILAAIPAAVLAGPAVPRNSDPLPSRSIVDNMTLAGTVQSVDQRRAEFVLLEHSGVRYTVRTRDADFMRGDRRGSFSDLRPSELVTVYGVDQRGGIIGADVVVISVLEDTYILPYGFEEVGRIVTARGVVESVDERRGRVTLHGERGLIELSIGREADIREAGRRRTIADIRPGTFLVVTGRLETIRSIAAHTINIGGPDPGTALFDTVLTGIVSRSTGLLDRTLVVRSPLGDVRLEIPRGADVRVSGYPASVHEIRRGDQVRATGRWSGGVFVVRQISALQTHQWEETGRIIRIDGNILVIRVGTAEYSVYARHADIRRDGRRISIRDLRSGDYIVVQGERRDNVIYAERIDVDTRRR
jgi:hypothetical protein